MRKALGFPDELYQRTFHSPRAAFLDEYESSTLLFTELKICDEKGLTLREWGKVPRWERRLWLYFKILDNEKQTVLMRRERDKVQAERARQADLPKVATIDRRFRA